MSQSIPGDGASALVQNSAASAVTQRTLENTLDRAFRLLRGISTNVAVRNRLDACGFTDADQQEGVELLAKASGFTPVTSASGDVADEHARAALAELDDADEGLFRIATATLNRRFPEQAKALLDGLAPVQGPQAILNVRTFLDRLDALESGSPTEAARSAIAILAKRGIDAAERARLRGLVEVALRAQPVVSTSTEIERRRELRNAALVALRDWYLEWSEVARACISRRDLLILLGLASRRTSRDEEEESAAPPAPTSPASPPAAPRP
jgi:hypothetical protein